MKNILLVLSMLFCYSVADAQTADKWNSSLFDGFSFRSIGPALMSGRIADIAIHPEDENFWYIAVGSGGVWKTVNAGNTWTPIFDNQSVYSTGCITIDPNNPNTIWLGTGENVGGRHASFGDGVYKSMDAGKTWKNMGLSKSEHISRILVHPENSDIIWLASQGPLWSKGGERGVYKSTDGGATWKQVLGNNQWTGATELVIDPNDPKILYAATWDRHRTVAAYMGGGPGSGLHKSIDGGDTWTELKTGLPKSNMGKIGLAISPHKSNVLYAAIELDRKKGAVYKSVDSGSSWTKMSATVSGGTGPHYYQELYACPHNFDRLYLMDVRMQVSDNGGKTFRRVTEKNKHSDNHAIAFKASDPDYLLVGTDGGMYESYDLGTHWRFFPNLPLTQFYKIAVDDAEPFYNVYGGTQDNSTQGGPSRTDNITGIQNSDWSVVLDWDGHQPATEPGNPDIMYGQRQQGTLSRIDLSNGEVVDIQPQPDQGEPYERFNWDAPILVSPHDPKQIYFGSQRLWRSDNRGDSWTALSEDVTRNENRFDMPIMGRKQSFDNPWDVGAMSNYNTITSIAESPVQRDLIYIGTDDGLILSTQDGGKNWRKMEASSLPGVPARAYVNDIKADLHDANTVYIALDNHKEGDYQPYLYKSTNGGQSWNKITTGIAKTNLCWRIVQDHVNKDLLFLATEFGIYFSTNGGNKWVQLKGNLPTISFRDIMIQRRENDLVCGSFGRSIYILDDISAFREISDAQLDQEASLFAPRDAWWYIPRSKLDFRQGAADQGAGYFVAKNPSHGVEFTVYNKEAIQSASEKRKAAEKKIAENQNINFPGWETLAEEKNAQSPKLWIQISDASGNAIRTIPAPSKKGFNRVAWDMRYPAPDMIELIPRKRGEWEDAPRGMLVTPSRYSAQLIKEENGEMHMLSEARDFTLKALHTGAIRKHTPEQAAAFWREYEETVRTWSATGKQLSTANQTMKAVDKAMRMTRGLNKDAVAKVANVRSTLQALNMAVNGNPSKSEVGEKNDPTIGNRLFAVYRGISNSTYGPTDTNKRSLEIINEEISIHSSTLQSVQSLLSQIGKAIVKNGGPMIEGVYE